ncbi:SagB family peptide dehydrogenase [Actinokineospora soli]|uniref:SagB family peptide dehydrogenase n=1 Tax=Actinokineospora soli TaxID=1048753 RepID=A0ABW2TPM2_9PSEU
MTTDPVERTADGRALYTLYPARRGERPGPRPDGDLVLSRFAVLHRAGDSLLVECPRAWCDVRVQDPSVLAALGLLATPTSAVALKDVLPASAVDTFLDDLWEARVVVPAVGADEETELRLRQWSPFELWLHNRSRLGAAGGFNASWGLTAWADGEFPPLPARPVPYPGEPVDLPVPNLAALRETDPTLTAVVEDRRSEREHGAPMTLRQLGEFLYRTARVRGTHELDGIEHVDRPFPSGGALHELEVYPLVSAVDGVGPGLYHYDGHTHQLRPVSAVNDGTATLRTAAELATGAEDPQVVLVVTARFGRLMWKYEAMGYAAILKDVGVLYQAFYSAATAMGLAACAVGGGHAEVFNEITGRDYLEEGVVGEFLLGTRKES